LISSHFQEFTQPKGEWLSQRTFGEHGGFRPGGDACAYRALSFRAQEFRARMSCGFSECAFSELIDYANLFRTTRDAGSRLRGKTASRSARRLAGEAGQPEKISINALITNRFPESLQPNIERLLQRTFGEQGMVRGRYLLRSRLCGAA
jgi:hypothetical protein